ncbi:MAG: ABC transporter substrate-binding protein [Aggregatilineales bacterium]
MAAFPIRTLIAALGIAIAAALLVILVGTLLDLVAAPEKRPYPNPNLFPNNELRVGIDPSYPPFASFNGSHLTGIDVDLAVALAFELGVRMRYVPLGFDGLYDALQAGQVDVLIAALRADPARGGIALYTQPYFNAGLVLVSPQSAKLDNMGQMGGHRLAVAFGSEAHSEAARWSRRIAPFTLLRYETSIDALDAVRLGEADAALIDSVTARLYLRHHPEWDGHMIEVTTVPVAMAVRADRPDQAAAISSALSALASRGTLEAIISRHLGQPP